MLRHSPAGANRTAQSMQFIIRQIEITLVQLGLSICKQAVAMVSKHATVSNSKLAMVLLPVQAGERTCIRSQQTCCPAIIV